MHGSDKTQGAGRGPTPASEECSMSPASEECSTSPAQEVPRLVSPGSKCRGVWCQSSFSLF